MAVSVMHSYDLKGKTLSFADWVSNINPTETPFCSMTGKEAVNQVKFQWQTDIIPAVNADNAQLEGSIPADTTMGKTTVHNNVCQIFRRGATVTDTANVVQYYGRGKEIGYQMEKASLEFKRDMEHCFLNSTADAAVSANGTPAKTAGFQKLVATQDAADPDTTATVHFETRGSSKIEKDDLFKMTYNLYLANSKANIIMFHPKHATVFSELISHPDITKGANQLRMFSNVASQYNAEVDTIIDPLGQKFALVPNRLMPEDALYFFAPGDWTQMVLRAPKKIQLDKRGSFEEWMIEAEVGLRHRNPYASGVLKVKA